MVAHPKEESQPIRGGLRLTDCGAPDVTRGPAQTRPGGHASDLELRADDGVDGLPARRRESAHAAVRRYERFGQLHGATQPSPAEQLAEDPQRSLNRHAQADPPPQTMGRVDVGRVAAQHDVGVRAELGDAQVLAHDEADSPGGGAGRRARVLVAGRQSGPAAHREGHRGLGPFRCQIHLRTGEGVTHGVAAEVPGGEREVRQHAADEGVVRSEQRPYVPVEASQEGDRSEQLDTVPDAEREGPGHRLNRRQALLPVEGRGMEAAGDAAVRNDLGGGDEPQTGVAEERHAGRTRVVVLRGRRTRPDAHQGGQRQEAEPSLLC